jgi:hypothetical protein
MQRTLGCALVLSLVFGGALRADTVAIPASKDNTLFEQEDGNLSNGSGRFIFAGLSRQAPHLQIRRAALAFDVAGSVPAGATITSVTLKLQVTRSISDDLSSSLHRLEADWGEGASDANAQEGTGTAAAAGDATWVHTFSPTDDWASDGGDFAAAASATTDVGGLGSYSWSSAQLAVDAQDMLDNPAGDFGWLLLVDEGTVGGAKQFASRENPDDPVPVLEIAFRAAGAKVSATNPVGIVLLGIVLLGGAAFIWRRRSVTA